VGNFRIEKMGKFKIELTFRTTRKFILGSDRAPSFDTGGSMADSIRNDKPLFPSFDDIWNPCVPRVFSSAKPNRRYFKIYWL
jgi:hypothetical protein